MSSTAPAFKYTARDYATIRDELRLLLLREIPEWVDSPATFESVFMDQVAYVGDIMHFYIDRLASEAYLSSAVRRESLLNIAYMLGYVPTPQSAAAGVVTFTKVVGLGDVTIPAGTRVYAQSEGFSPIQFETKADHVITGATADIEVVEGVSVTTELLGVSTGAASQTFSLYNYGAIKNSVQVYTRDGNVSSSTGYPTLVEWTFTERIVDGEFFDRAYSLAVDSDGFTYVAFGDGVSGAVPATGVEIYCTYRHGQGSGGNVAASAIKSLSSGGELTGRVASVNNDLAMQGGADAESIESMRTSIPKSVRAVERAVTKSDFESLAIRVGGVAKSSSNPASSVTSVQVAVAPVGGGAPTATLLEEVEVYMAERKMVGVDFVAVVPVYVPLNITVNVDVDSRYRQNDVKDATVAAVEALYAFDNVNFMQRVTKAGVFKVTVDIEGAEYVSITTFNRDGAGDDNDFVLAYNEIPELGSLIVNATGGITPS
jgi:uncharacterized phage protein gp47/JayE